jgi:hypothetical protein
MPSGEMVASLHRVWHFPRSGPLGCNSGSAFSRLWMSPAESLSAVATDGTAIRSSCGSSMTLTQISQQVLMSTCRRASMCGWGVTPSPGEDGGVACRAVGTRKAPQFGMQTPFPMTVVSVSVTNALWSKVLAANGRNRLDRKDSTASGIYDPAIQGYQQNHHNQKQKKVERPHGNLSQDSPLMVRLL